jgi:putative PIN family toxin of toxin-antitoxin system
MLRVTADTNIYISALMFGGLPGIFLDLAVNRSFTLVTSASLLVELDEKLRGKFRVSPTGAEAIRDMLESISDIVEPGFVLNVVVDDPDDNRVLECAAAGKAEIIVSGDKHLLRLRSYEAIRIVTVRQFFDAHEIASSGSF